MRERFCYNPQLMKINRRYFIKATGLGMGALSLGPQLSRGAAASGRPGFVARPAKMHLGLVTYNMAADWDSHDYQKL